MANDLQPCTRITNRALPYITATDLKDKNVLWKDRPQITTPETSSKITTHNPGDSALNASGSSIGDADGGFDYPEETVLPLKNATEFGSSDWLNPSQDTKGQVGNSALNPSGSSIGDADGGFDYPEETMPPLKNATEFGSSDWLNPSQDTKGQVGNSALNPLGSSIGDADGGFDYPEETMPPLKNATEFGSSDWLNPSQDTKGQVGIKLDALLTMESDDGQPGCQQDTEQALADAVDRLATLLSQFAEPLGSFQTAEMARALLAHQTQLVESIETVVGEIRAAQRALYSPPHAGSPLAPDNLSQLFVQFTPFLPRAPPDHVQTTLLDELSADLPKDGPEPVLRVPPDHVPIVIASELPALMPSDNTQRRALVTKELTRTLREATGISKATLIYAQFDKMVKARYGYDLVGWPADVPYQSFSNMRAGVSAVVKHLYQGLLHGTCYWFKMPEEEHQELRKKHGMVP
ncbi:hypothetical protein FB45DRAFT_147569 [Roridomyces roridus]|uniref:Uncharacterized protein n=1 Tax=Roridomyces roridus TaxID=1738132 RepID=A0AAD7FF09_9AGAR|nr:hypothetical protein FB45DRAFT_147569 [Roridomyces roridus]